MNSPVQWVGGKRWHAPLVQQMWSGQRLVELFCGGCSVSFALEPKHAVLNDMNPHLINFFAWLKYDGFALWSDMTRDALRYTTSRKEFNAIRGSRSAREAQLFFYLNAHCYNGLWRVNSKGEFNVPMRPSRHVACWPSRAYGHHEQGD